MSWKFADYPECNCVIQQQLKDSMDSDSELIWHQHQRHMDVYNKGCHGENLAFGDLVWLFIPAVKRHMKKFSSLWKGLYTIVDKCGPVNYKIQLILTVLNSW